MICFAIFCRYGGISCQHGGTNGTEKPRRIQIIDDVQIITVKDRENCATVNETDGYCVAGKRIC